jgi:hypothetical protein
MNFKALLMLMILMILFSFCGCERSVETTFGKNCKKITFNSEKMKFKSDYDGSFMFQLEEDADKESGSLMIGSFAGIVEGNDLILTGDNVPDHINTIYLFSREDGMEQEYFYADSGKIETELLYYSSKGNIDFMKGYFYRLVFVNSYGECRVVERIDFAFY